MLNDFLDFINRYIDRLVAWMNSLDPDTSNWWIMPYMPYLINVCLFAALAFLFFMLAHILVDEHMEHRKGRVGVRSGPRHRAKKK